MMVVSPLATMPVVKRRLGNPEQILQRAIASWLRVVLPTPEAGGPVWTAVNPVPGKSRASAGISKAMGLAAGFPDIVMIWQGRAIVFELKAKGGTTSDAQKAMIKALSHNCAHCFVIRSIEEMRLALRGLAVPTREARFT